MSKDQQIVRKIKVIVKGRTPRVPFERASGANSEPAAVESLAGLQKALVPNEPSPLPEKTEQLIDESRLQVQLENRVAVNPGKLPVPVRIKLRGEQAPVLSEPHEYQDEKPAVTGETDRTVQLEPVASPAEGTIPGDTILNGRYRVMGLVKDESLRRVYLGIDQKGGQAPVKLIEVLSPSTDGEFFAKRARVLMDSLRKLVVYKHPNAASVRDIFRYGRSEFYVVDYVKGQNLLQIMKNSGGKLSEEESADVGIALADVLVFLQSRRIPVYLDRLDLNDLIIDEKGVLAVTNYNLHLLFDPFRVEELIPGNPEYCYDQVTWVAGIVYYILTGTRFKDYKTARSNLKKMGKYMGSLLEQTCPSNQKKVGDLRVLRKMLEKAPIRTKNEDKDIQKFAWKFMKAG